METYSFNTDGRVCSQLMTVCMEKDVIISLEVRGGCPGNLQGICHLVKGMKVTEVIERLSGIRCGDKSTSCPDQLAAGLRKILEEKGKKK